jgi:2-phosphosulfolactate phosphatase
MGSNGIKPTLEDELCASYIEETLLGKTLDFDDIAQRIRESPSGSKFFDPSKPQFHEQDFHMALELNKFDFILRVSQLGQNKRYVLKERP